MLNKGLRIPKSIYNKSLCKICRAHGDRVFLILKFQEGVK